MSTEDTHDVAAETDGVPPEKDRSVKIRVENVAKRFGRVVALEDVDLDVYENEIFALIGDNGAGKSTLMNVLSGALQPTEGRVYLDGRPVSFDNPSDAREAGIETVYQDLALMNDLDIATNVFMGQFPTTGVGPVRFIDWEETYERAEHIVHDQLGRGMDIRAEVEFLSGGQRQLVAIGRTLAFDPDVIILDEPTSALSIDASKLVHETIRRLKADGRTIIIVSHSIEDVLELADRIGVLFQGKIAEVTTPANADLEALSNLMVTGTRNGN